MSFIHHVLRARAANEPVAGDWCYVLHRDVRDAVAAERFRIFAIEHVEDTWPILMGREAEEQRPDGTFPDRTVHRAVADRVSAWASEWPEYNGAMPRGRAA